MDVLGARRAGQAGPQQRHDFAMGAPALTLVLVQHHFVKGMPQHFGLLADVFIAPVARAADDHRAAFGGHVFNRLDQG